MKVFELLKVLEGYPANASVQVCLSDVDKLTNCYSIMGEIDFVWSSAFNEKTVHADTPVAYLECEVSCIDPRNKPTKRKPKKRAGK